MSSSVTHQPSVAKLHWDANGQPKSTQFDDFYFSSDDGIAETQYVFIDNNQLMERWQRPHPKPSFTLAETGFGSGLSFLIAWQHWRNIKPCTTSDNRVKLHFISVEKHPLSFPDIRRALALWPTLSPLSEALLNQYPPQPIKGCCRLSFDQGNVVLTLYFGDATEGLSQFLPCSTLGKPHTGKCQFGAPGSEQPFTVDAWFLDGFSPSKNPDMWTPQLFAAIARLSAQGTTFSTFTSARCVQDGLKAEGFSFRKMSGFGMKRQMLAGEFVAASQLQTDTQLEQPKPKHTEEGHTEFKHAKPNQRGNAAHHFWHLVGPAANDFSSSKTVLIIGGGLAGCQAAAALANKGFHVTLLEQNTRLAQEASGNRQGVVYTRLSPHPDPLSEFNLAAQVFANQFYAGTSPSQKASYFRQCGEQSGVVHLAMSDKQRRYYQQLSATFADSPDFCRWCSEDDISSFSGVKVKHPGLLVPKAGWLAPTPLCEALVKSPKIRILTNSSVAKLERLHNHWQAFDKNGTLLASAANAVIANAKAANRLTQTAHLPLKPIRGQVTHIKHAPASLCALNTVLCGEGYISPADAGIHCIGASFNLNDDNTALTAQDHTTNLYNLNQMVSSNLSEDNTMVLDGRVGFRTTTPDYFPIVGPAPRYDGMRERFAALSHNANASTQDPGDYYPQLYTLLGLGSRGLAYSPLAAELLASILAGEALPIRQALYLKLHPARFLIRDLIRNKTSTLNP